jgi:hypothetical protein
MRAKVARGPMVKDSGLVNCPHVNIDAVYRRFAGEGPGEGPGCVPVRILVSRYLGTLSETGTPSDLGGNCIGSARSQDACTPPKVSQVPPPFGSENSGPIPQFFFPSEFGLLT